jgi:hypothetical protein
VGAETGDVPIRWGAEGQSLLVWNSVGYPLKIYRLDLTTGNRQMLKERPSPDPAGLELTGYVAVTPDLKSYAMSFGRILSALYLVDGLQ